MGGWGKRRSDIVKGAGDKRRIYVYKRNVEGRKCVTGWSEPAAGYAMEELNGAKWKPMTTIGSNNECFICSLIYLLLISYSIVFM